MTIEDAYESARAGLETIAQDLLPPHDSDAASTFAQSVLDGLDDLFRNDPSAPAWIIPERILVEEFDTAFMERLRRGAEGNPIAVPERSGAHLVGQGHTPTKPGPRNPVPPPAPSDSAASVGKA